MTLTLYLIDALKSLLLGAILGLPLLFGVLWLMERMGDILVAVCVAGMGRLQPADPVHLPDVHRAAVQQVHAAAGRGDEGAHRSLAQQVRLYRAAACS